MVLEHGYVIYDLQTQLVKYDYYYRSRLSCVCHASVLASPVQFWSLQFESGYYKVREIFRGYLTVVSFPFRNKKNPAGRIILSLTGW